MEQPGVSRSRFYMWRAILAIAHADGRIDKSERDFIESYMGKLPFSAAQKAVLADDVLHARGAGEMLAQATEPEDQGQFFQFARMMVWCDGNYEQQEKEIMERLLNAHMEGIDAGALSQALSRSRLDTKAVKAVAQAYARQQAQKKVGVGPLIAQFFGGPKTMIGRPVVTESRFFMWRAIFAMAHADDEVTSTEKSFMYDALNAENFSDAQRAQLEKDIDEPQKIGAMFMQIADQEDRSRFFYYARMLCWSDGNFDEQEQKIILSLRRLHTRNVDFDKAMATVDMELADEYKGMLEQDMKDREPALAKFLRRFRD